MQQIEKFIKDLNLVLPKEYEARRSIKYANSVEVIKNQEVILFCTYECIQDSAIDMQEWVLYTLGKIN